MADAIRKPLGAILIILALVGYAALVGLASAWLTQMPILLQGLAYLVLGVAWVPALMPLTRWTETGRLRKRRATEQQSG